MSAVELAIRKVKKLSDRQARELLGWLDKRRADEPVRRRRSLPARRKPKVRRSTRELMSWYDSVRGTTDWQPARMPDDLVKPVCLL